MSQYVLSLIPVKSYELQKGEQIPELFTTRGDKGGFSGIAIYSCLYTGVTARVDTYRNGRKVNGIFLLDAKEQEELNSKIETAKEQIYMLSLQKKKKILSRGVSDYGYDIDGGWLDEVIITPEEPWEWVGADGMTNEEWLEKTRPDGNVDPQPEPEPELPEEDYYIPEDDKTVTVPIVIGNIINETNMNSVQLGLLGKALNELKNDKLGNMLYNSLKDDFKIGAKMKPTSVYDAIYSKKNKCVYFKSDTDIDANKLLEELVHAVQHSKYGDEMTSAIRNYEFEAKVIQDINCATNKGGFCGYIGEVGMMDNTEWCKDYEKLIEANVWNEKSLNSYYELGNEWNQYQGAFDDKVAPIVINWYFENLSDKPN